MAKIYPLQPLRYTAEAGPLANLVTQPYDKISPAMQARYLSLSPYNLVRLILGERKPEDNQAGNVYTRAAAYLNDWIARGVLARDAAPAIFPYFQDFTVPDTGERLTRKGFIALGAVEDYSAGIVHRHEQTLAGPKKDRLELLRHTHAHCGQIFMLYPDRAGEIDALIEEAAQAAPLAEVTDEYGVGHRMWRVAGAARIQESMADKKLLIADGHHRYETALAFRNENPGLAGADAWARPAGPTVIGAAIGTRLFLLQSLHPAGELDVRVLHERLLAQALSIGEEAVRDEKHLRYIRGLDAAIAEARSGAAQIAFLLRPTSIEQVADTSFSGGVMPQKSTDFYPKLLSGMTIYRIDK